MLGRPRLRGRGITGRERGVFDHVHRPPRKLAPGLRRHDAAGLVVDDELPGRVARNGHRWNAQRHGVENRAAVRDAARLPYELHLRQEIGKEIAMRNDMQPFGKLLHTGPPQQAAAEWAGAHEHVLDAAMDHVELIDAPE